MKWQCACASGKTGSNCEIDICPASLADFGFSLGQLLLAGTKRLQDDSARFDTMTTSEVASSDNYLHDFLFVGVDRNADGMITKQELVRYFSNLLLTHK